MATIASADERIAGEIGKAVMTLHRQGEFIEAAQQQLLVAYEALAQCIRSDQVPDAPAVLEADPAFAAWYKGKFGLARAPKGAGQDLGDLPDKGLTGKKPRS